MLATFIIGLREGLEAALIIGIIAAFLKKAGRSLAPMWLGVVLALILSVAIGTALKLLERELPQQRQEALETIIGAVAVVFVTGMIVWMNDHAREMKSSLEHEAAEALSQGNARSLAIMAFLAVMKEGIETSVFLVATFSVAQSTRLAATGAILGIVIASIIGYGIYVGGVRINLGKFFRVTGVFLILVAAGLTLNAVRTAHSAGWLNGGQQKTIDLTSLVEPGTVQSALITGVLGIPSDPRLIEVLAWFAYVIPVSIYVYWPAKWRPKGAAIPKTKLAIAAVLMALSIGLYLGYPSPAISTSGTVNLVSTQADQTEKIGTAALISDSGSLALRVSLNGEEPTLVPLEGPGTEVDVHNGLKAQQWVVPYTTTSGEAKTITLNELIELNGGRIPIGVDANRNPGPFTMTQSTAHSTVVTVYHGAFMDVSDTSKTIIEISDGGLEYPRTINASRGGGAGWEIASEDQAAQITAINDLDVQETEYKLWARQLPALLAMVALGFGISGFRSYTYLKRKPAHPPDTHAPPAISNPVST